MKESPEEKRRRLLELAKASVTTAYSTGEHSVILAINTYNEIEHAKNLIYEKLEEWYGIFFPELRLTSQLTYARFVVEFGMDKKLADKERLSSMLGAGAEAAAEKASKSIGREPSEAEYLMLKQVAESELYLDELQLKLDSYLAVEVKKLMPNISYLVDYKIAAELLAKAGSLSKLGFMPASTIQLLGAEKALFKHIKFHTRPPKYGVLFKLPQITNASHFKRGRIARLYATKICIAAKADAFTKNFIAEKLKKDLASGLERIAKEPERTDAQRQAGREQYPRGHDSRSRPPRWQHGGRDFNRAGRHRK